MHVPEEYGGAGADALATVIVIEEVARVCASSSLIPAVNKLGSLPVILSGSEELKKKYMTPLAKGDGMFSYCLSEPDAGSDAAGMKTKAVRDGDSWVLNGVKRWITNAGESEYYTVMAVTDPAKRSKGHLRLRRREVRRGRLPSAPRRRSSASRGSPTREVYLDNVRIPADRMIGEEGTGFATAMKTLDHTRITIAAQALGIAQGALDYAKGYVEERKQFGKPIADFQGIQFMLADMAMKIEAARQLTYAAAAKSQRGDSDLTFQGAAAKCFASDAGDGGHHGRGPAPRRLRLHPRLPGGAHDARRQDHADLRGHEPGPAHRDGAQPAVTGVVRLTRRARPQSSKPSATRRSRSSMMARRRARRWVRRIWASW